MPAPKINSFTSYALSEEEILQAATLSPIQEMHFQSLLAEAAEARLNLDYNPQNPGEFLQQEAFLKGQIETLKTLLLASTEAQAEYLHLAQQSA